MNREYIETVTLLLEIAPRVFQSRCFAMKGGTALNLFVQEMPRLSVDIDVVYVDHAKERAAAFAEIADELAGTKQKLEKLGFDVRLVSTKQGEDLKLLVSNEQNLVKAEVNHVFRGTVLPIETCRLTAAARELFGTDLSVPILAVPELYGGKLVAALDRQHPRDLFDVLGMYQRFGLSESIVECFVSYLAGHNRPIHEVLFSRDQDMAAAFEKEFSGMTNVPVTLLQLNETRQRLRRDLARALTDGQKRFLISLANGEPDWTLMACRHLRELSAIRWKVLNLGKLKKTNPEKLRQQSDELQRQLDGIGED